MSLTPGQLAALRNLAEKEAGQDVGWISIADARSLTELGLAERARSGWRITDKGRTELQASPSGEVVRFEFSPHRRD